MKTRNPAPKLPLPHATATCHSASANTGAPWPGQPKPTAQAHAPNTLLAVRGLGWCLLVPEPSSVPGFFRQRLFLCVAVTIHTIALMDSTMGTPRFIFVCDLRRCQFCGDSTAVHVLHTWPSAAGVRAGPRFSLGRECKWALPGLSGDLGGFTVCPHVGSSLSASRTSEGQAPLLYSGPFEILFCPF